MSRTRLLTLVGILMLCSLASADGFRKRDKPKYRVPEPTTIALASAGVVGVAAAIWRKVRK